MSNISIGATALTQNSTGINNVALGVQALQNSTGNNNIGIGVNALGSLTSGNNNTGIGLNTLASLTSGIINTAVGRNALNNTTGSANVGLGNSSGFSNAGGTGNTYLGALTASTGGPFINSTAVGYQAEITESNNIVLGNSSITALRCQVGTITGLSDIRDKKDIEPIPQGLSFINDLKPVKFTWNMRDKGKIDIDEFGFIAQELEQTQNKFGVVPNLVDASDPDKYAASYGTLLPVMVKAIQDLTSEIEEIKKKL